MTADQPRIVWTGREVARRLAPACRSAPRIVSRGPADATGPACWPGAPHAWPARYVARPEDRVALERWVYAKAGWEVIEDVCRDLRVSRSTFEDRRRRALRQIADALNREVRDAGWQG